MVLFYKFERDRCAADNTGPLFRGSDGFPLVFGWPLWEAWLVDLRTMRGYNVRFDSLCWSIPSTPVGARISAKWFRTGGPWTILSIVHFYWISARLYFLHHARVMHRMNGDFFYFVFGSFFIFWRKGLNAFALREVIKLWEPIFYDVWLIWCGSHISTLWESFSFCYNV